MSHEQTIEKPIGTSFRKWLEGKVLSANFSASRPAFAESRSKPSKRRRRTIPSPPKQVALCGRRFSYISPFEKGGIKGDSKTATPASTLQRPRISNLFDRGRIAVAVFTAAVDLLNRVRYRTLALPGYPLRRSLFERMAAGTLEPDHMFDYWSSFWSM